MAEYDRQDRFLIADGTVYRIADTDSADDAVIAIIEEHAEPDAVLRVLNADAVEDHLDGPMPEDFPGAAIEVFGPGGEVKEVGWLPETVLMMTTTASEQQEPEREPEESRAQESAPTAPETGPPDDGAPTPGQEPAQESAWAVGSRIWADVPQEDVDTRMLIATSRGIVTPSGEVVSRPFAAREHLGMFVCKYTHWGIEPEDEDDKWDPQRVKLAITPYALKAMGFEYDNILPSELDNVVSEAFGAKVTYSKSGWFTLKFPEPPAGGAARSVEVLLLPFVHLDPSKSRPNDRGIAGIVGKDTYLSADELKMAHSLGRNIQWLWKHEGATPGPRWSTVGATIAMRIMKRSKDGKWAALEPAPIPPDVSKRGRLYSPWWVKSWKPAKPDNRYDGLPLARFQFDQQNAYLPSATGAFLGYGKPLWDNKPEISEFFYKEKYRPPFVLAKTTIAAGDVLPGMDEGLPLPIPGMRWDKEVTMWLPTVEIEHLLKPIEKGGWGLDPGHIRIDRTYRWPNQAQMLRGFGELLNKSLVRDRANGDEAFVDMNKAIYASFFGRTVAAGDGQFDFPFLKFRQPVWCMTWQALTRHRAMAYAKRIRDNHGLYPVQVLVDAWFYDIPADMDYHFLEDERNNDGVFNNGSYRYKGRQLLPEKKTRPR